MDYCKYRNTLVALRQCAKEWEEDHAGLSQDELKAKKSLIQLMATLIEMESDT